MKKILTLALALMTAVLLFTGCRSNNPASTATPQPSPTASAQPSATPTVAPTTAPTAPTDAATQPPDIVPTPDASANPTGGIQAEGLASWESGLGYSTYYDPARFQASETDGGDLFAAVPASGEASLQVRRILSFTATQLDELLALREQGAQRLSQQLGEESYPVHTVTAGPAQYDILDCGTELLLFTAYCPAEDTEGQKALQSLRDGVRLFGRPALLQVLAELNACLEPDSAGGSLRSAIYAGRILDWYAENRPELQALADMAAAYGAVLPQTEAAAFSNKLEAVYGAALLLTEKEGKSLLEASGYKARHFPWTENDAKTAFTALLSVSEEGS